MCLRDAYTGKLLNVSYSEEGLKWTQNRFRKLLYFRKARLQVTLVNGKPHLIPVGDLSKSDHVYVEEFIPQDHYNKHGQLDRDKQLAEYQWCNKAVKLYYYIPQDSYEFN